MDELGGGWRRRASIACPKCNRMPVFRITGAGARYVGRIPPGVSMLTYVCQARGCGYVYEVHAGALQQSRPDKLDRAA